jgi:hypothetical protein
MGVGAGLPRPYLARTRKKEKMEQAFYLQPFASNELSKDLKIVGTIDRNIDRLAICYELIGNLKVVSIASYCGRSIEKSISYAKPRFRKNRASRCSFTGFYYQRY